MVVIEILDIVTAKPVPNKVTAVLNQLQFTAIKVLHVITLELV
jgi:hypothetical protein